MQAKTFIYPLKIQAIRRKGRTPTLYVYFPLPLDAAINLKPGEQVQWELLDRSELHLARQKKSKSRATFSRKNQKNNIITPSF